MNTMNVEKDKKVVIIAEAGVNHNGQLDLAYQLVDVAAEAGADYVKFQTFKANKVVVADAKKAEYQKQSTGSDESQQDMIRRLELDRGAHLKLIQRCSERGIGFLSTAFDDESIDLLQEFNMDVFKIPSGEITNLPYLRRLASIGKPLIMSTGLATLADVETALDILISNGCDRGDITILHCTTQYPTPMEDVNLRAMLTIAEAFKVKVGYSDHTVGIEIAIAAVAMGATVIEKHFTIDRTLPGPDHSASLEPTELRNMVASIRNIEVALGDGIKCLTPSEAPNRDVARRSIVTAAAIAEGEVFTEKNLTVKRPGSGVSPLLWDQVIGTVATRSYDSDELISW